MGTMFLLSEISEFKAQFLCLNFRKQERGMTTLDNRL